VDKKQATIESKGTTEQAPYIGFVDSKGQMVKVVELPFYCNHYHANNDHTLLVGDGVEDLVLINISGNKGEIEVLCSHNTSWNTQQTHCHPTFSYNNEQILFTSDREGVCNLYLIDIPK
jgi:oligogalacturonide lyase